jgi:HK97 gp10 family phage protein
MGKNVVKNLDKVIKQMQNLGVNAEKSIVKINEKTAQEIVSNAKVNARNLGVFDNGKLVQGIATNSEGKLNQVVFAKEKYSAYMEFGTGGLVSVPSELKEVAAKFKGKGIKKINIQPRPFLYPAFVKGRVQYLEDLKAKLNELVKKNG